MRKTPNQKYIDKALAEAVEKSSSLTVTDCAFNGVKFDEGALGAIEMIAEGLKENAKSLGALAHVFKASNINIEAMIRADVRPTQE